MKALLIATVFFLISGQAWLWINRVSLDRLVLRLKCSFFYTPEASVRLDVFKAFSFVESGWPAKSESFVVPFCCWFGANKSNISLSHTREALDTHQRSARLMPKSGLRKSRQMKRGLRCIAASINFTESNTCQCFRCFVLSTWCLQSHLDRSSCTTSREPLSS